MNYGKSNTMLIENGVTAEATPSAENTLKLWMT